MAEARRELSQKNILERKGSGRNVHREERRHSLLKECIFLTRSQLLCLCRMEAPSSGHDTGRLEARSMAVVAL